MDSLSAALTRMMQIETSSVVGFCFLDSDKRLVQIMDDDPNLREMILEYHRQRVAELRLSEKGPAEARPYLTKSD